MKTGLFVNSIKANCSIYESGIMIRNILWKSQLFSLDYIEATPTTIPRIDFSPYDFYVLNWHHFTLPIPQDVLGGLKGKKIAIVLEVFPNDCFPHTPKWFDAYMVIDPTKEKDGKEKIYPFPRPLETFLPTLPEKTQNDLPVIGSFGLLTPGKRFEEIIQVANTMGNCVVRINLPPVTYMGDIGASKRLTDYAKWLHSLARPNVDLTVTHNYMTKRELIEWCCQNTINVFPYYRTQSGLAATTDQAIVAGRAIAITSNHAFHHMHPYISYYPKQGYWELIESTPPGVAQMQKDWHPAVFLSRFEEMLSEEGVL